jgi:hypothetical protein
MVRFSKISNPTLKKRMMIELSFAETYTLLIQNLWHLGHKVPMKTWQSQLTGTKPGMSYSRELTHVSLRLQIPKTHPEAQQKWALMTQANMPWAEDHFLERVSGFPWNPPPSEAWWPYRVNGNAEHKDGELFSHTYPERFWPKVAGENVQIKAGHENQGIRFDYGDLRDVVQLLARDILTRQAYLPVWFPEDTGAVDRQRVPCTLGYHFLFRPGPEEGFIGDIVYYLRSCDLFRHFNDDAYMAGRLLQWVSNRLWDHGIHADASSLIMHISSLHTFEGDEMRLQALAEEEIYGAPI